MKDLLNDDVHAFSKDADKIVHDFNITNNVVDLNEHIDGPKLIVSNKLVIDTTPIVYKNMVPSSLSVVDMLNSDAIQEQNQSKNDCNLNKAPSQFSKSNASSCIGSLLIDGGVDVPKVLGSEACEKGEFIPS